MTHDLTPNRLRLACFAVYAAFFANGFTVGHWAPKIPVMVERLSISEATLGQMIILFGIGAMIALVAGAGAVAKLGSVKVVRWTSLLLVPSLIMITITPSVITTALAMLWLGCFMGAMDNAMNANGVGVEVALKRPVMSSFHGFWSLGGVVGGLTGGWMIATFGELGHALIVAALTALCVGWAWRHYLPDAPDTPASQNAGPPKRFSAIPRKPGIYVLGIITLLAFAPEGTVIDWSGLYLKDEIGAPILISGYAFAAFSATMALMRFFGDRLRTALGDRVTFVISTLLAGSGLLAAGYADSIIAVCLAFLVAGIGMANVVPVLFSAAGRYPGLKPSIAIAVITAFGYSGLLFVPALVGLVAERWSLSFVFIAWGVIVVTIAGLGTILPNLRGKQPAPVIETVSPG